ncbi:MULTISPECIES: PHP domain-containing protein [unclassified Actinobaculum]|uniref:PHP domain-containing protein n=1 Tax=unclassified Actinobaculum TaxID=2609299 RepID=UPI000D529F88|nr:MULTISPECIES: PHP domain-containing protein [unclassified Actinobaculum]AWE42146.1 phosphatase [Actinobaculum sp. 313]RTE50709.1 PHP domain-containing protein [Actinobaculum sp. 352]
MRIDPHTHSTASDGTETPAQLMMRARHAALDMVGLTDHDTTAGWSEAAAAVLRTGVGLLRGMEFSARYHGISIHILGLLFDDADADIRQHCRRVRESRVGRARAMVERLAEDVPVSWEDVVAQVSGNATIGRPHIADALVARGVVSSRAEAFDRFLNPRSPYYVPHYAPAATDVIRWVKNAGGETVFAHPRAPGRGRVVPWEAFDELAQAGLFGVEIDHRDNTAESIPQLEQMVRHLHLARFGASDYHGAGKPNRLGERTTSPAVIEALTERCLLEVIHP